MGTWQPPYAPARAVQNKVADADGVEKMSLNALLGHACGSNFQGSGTSGKASRVRVAEGYAARYELAGLDEVHGEVGFGQKVGFGGIVT